MVDRIFIIVCVVLGCSLLKIGLAHDSDHGNDGGHGGHGGGGGGGGNEPLNVVISYETLNDCAESFFKEQLTAQVLEEFMKCSSVRFTFMPCTTSCMVNGVLQCRCGECQCAEDRIQACVAELYKQDQHKVGKFVICYFTGNDAEQCACKNGMKWDTINKCVLKHDGDKYCNDFFDHLINDMQTNGIPGIKFGSKYDEDLNEKATDDFKGVLCTQLKKHNLQCAACSCN